jgi:hypothetical protein
VDYSPTQIRADTTTATAKSPPASISLHVDHNAYNTTQPEQLYSLLITATATPPCGAIDALADRAETVTKPLNPADYSLDDIEAVLLKIQKRHGRTGIPIPESVQETAKALRRMVRTRDAANPTQITTELIADFDSDTAALAPALTSAPVSTPAQTFVSIPIPIPTPVPAPTAMDLSSAKTTELMAVVRPTMVEQCDTKLPNNKEIEERMEGGEDERQQGREENEGNTEREETRDDKGIEGNI